MKKDAKGRNRISKVVGILILILLSACVLRAETDERLTYTVVDNGTAIEMTGCRQIETGRLVIPETVEGKPVVAVARFLKNCQALKSIHLPKTVSRVSAQSFSECPGLETIEIALDHLFYASRDGVLFNKDLTTLIRCPPGKKGDYTVPESVVTIADKAFSGCRNLTDIILPESLVSIGDEAFFTCERLESIHLPDALVSIGYAAFRDCDGLAQVRIPGKVSEIGGYAFSWFGFNSRLERIDVAEENEHYRSIDGVLFSKDLTRLIQYPRRKSGPYVIPEGVKHIDVCAFNICQSLTEIVFPSTLESIDSCAFELCEKLQYIRAPARVERIEPDAFKQCYGLEAFMVETNNRHYASVEGVLFDKELKQLIQCPAKKSGVYTVPEGVESIAFEAFDECNRLTEIILPDSLVSIGAFAFSGCYGLTNFIIPDGVKSIGMDAFNGCAGLTNIFIPASVRSAESIGLGAHVAVSEGNEQYTSVDGVLFSKDMTVLHRCPVDKSGTYTIPGSVTSVVENAFSNCDRLTNIVFPESLVSIEAFSFSDCSSLKHIILPESLTSIGSHSFYNCGGLESVTIPASIRNIGHAAFLWCRALQSISVDSGNLHYASRDGVLFNREFTDLIQYPLGRAGTFTIPGSVTKIQDLAVSGSSLQKINLSESTAVIERNAFSNCSGLKEMVFPAGISFLSEYAFNDCENMRSAYFLGDAPILESSLAFYETNPKFTVYYSSKSHGFDSPVWSGFRLRSIHPASLWLMTSGRYVFWAVLLVLLGVLLVSCWCAIRFVTRQHRRKHANGLNPNQ